MKCPHCKEPLDYLHCYSECKQTLELTDTNEPLYNPVEEILETYSYECPSCGEELTESEEEAIKLLEGVEQK